LNIQNSNNQTTTTWQAFSYLFNEFLHFYFESGKEVGGGGDIPWTLMAVWSMTDDVVVCVLSAVCCCRCLAFRDRINFFPLHLHPRRAARQLAYIFSTCTTSTLIMIAAAAAFYFISFFIFYFYLTEEVWSLGIVSPGPCRSLFIPGRIDICELRV
jgi:hypothetical protein